MLSQDIVYGGERIADLSVGDDAAEALGMVKWVPPVPVHMSGLMVPGLKIGYDIDDVGSWPDRTVDGEDVVITEKLHGSFLLSRSAPRVAGRRARADGVLQGPTGPGAAL